MPLAPLTTLKVGGEARFFVRAENEEQVIKAFDFAKAKNLAVFVLGGGSNVVVSDDGFDGLVLQIALKGVTKFREKDAAVYVTAGAGEDWDALVAQCVTDGLQGIECLSGIPGFVGGTPVQNVGAYGQDVSETIVAVRAFDRDANATRTLTNSDCGFSYRASIFNTSQKEKYVVLAVTYALQDGGKPRIVYKDLRDFFGDRVPTLAETREAVLNIRRSKSMVIDEADPNSRSAGSFFKNPVLLLDELARIEGIVGSKGVEKVPTFPAGDGKVKIPAAWLIENSGFTKGYTLGPAGLSTKHTLALINRGEASAGDIIRLKELIQRKVWETFAISLQTEPVFVGFTGANN